MNPLLGISIFGILGLTVLCPFLAWVGQACRSRPANRKRVFTFSPASPILIDIIIPAHNEAHVIGATLASIERAITHLLATRPFALWPEIAIHVGADACSDMTSTIARQYARVVVTEYPEHNSKWLTLKELCLNSQADWLIAVDAGTLWPENFLTEVVPAMTDRPEAIALSPAYCPQNTGVMHRVLWKIEKKLKELESFCGGPVSVHGATICYSVPPLQKALHLLGDTPWLNDDVVIPLMLRSLYPEAVILYPVAEVQDAGATDHKLDLQRRTRILLGNLQWVGNLWPLSLKINPVAGVVAARRVFRVFWAYWIVFAAFSFAFQGPVPSLILVAFLIFFLRSFRELAGAALVSLMAPFRLTRRNWQLQGVWK